MSLDPIRNHAIVTISTGYDIDDTTIVLASGHGAKLPDPATEGAFNLVWWNNTDYKNPSLDPKKEIVRVTARSGDTLTITRPASGNNYNGEGSENIAQTHNIVGRQYKFVLTPTRKYIEDIQTEINKRNIVVTVGAADADYITDGVDDQVEINQALQDCYDNFLSTGVGSTVRLKLQGFNISSPILLKNNINLEGAGRKTTINVTSAINGLELYAEDQSIIGLVLKNFRVRGNNAGQYGIYLHAAGSYEFTVFHAQDIAVDGFDTGVYNAAPFGGLFTNCVFEAMYGSKIGMYFVTGEIVTNRCWFENLTVGIQVRGQSYLVDVLSKFASNVVTKIVKTSALGHTPEVSLLGHYINLDNLDDTNAINITQVGTTGINAADDGAIHLDNTANSGIGMSLYTNMDVALGDLAVLYVDNAAFDKRALRIVNDGIGQAIYVTNNGLIPNTGKGIIIETTINQTNSGAILNLIRSTHTSAIATVNYVQALNDGRASVIEKAVTDVNNTRASLDITDKSTVDDGNTYTKSGNVISVVSSVVQTSGTITDTKVLVNLSQNNTSATGNVVSITNAGSGKGIYIDNNGNGRSIDIDHDGNSASAITSIFVNVANAGAGKAYGILVEAGNVGFMTITPTAYLHLGAGTIAAGTAPLKFTSGPLLTTPEAGAIEFLTDAVYVTITTGTARKQLAFIDSPKRVSTIASNATPTPNAATDDIFTVTALATGATFAAPSGTPTSGQSLIIRIKDNGSAQTLAYNAIYRALGVVLPATTVISKTLYLGMIYNAEDSKWDVVSVGQEA